MRRILQWVFRDIDYHFNNLHHVLSSILKEITAMATTLAQLDESIQTLSASVGQLITDVQAFIAKVPPSPDYSAELDKVNTAIANLNDADTGVKTALEPPVPPVV